ncbi:hypothetical protein QYE76_043274 [Lolium multiflorum]|uniref:Reverse transcriptase domain-containing protein n=1 Tax=Lolium multiflorum TaxID=4521 RepID=A0AAD8WXS5_LOLMU|nr:hypothetical protein QYE76_043274 [Lolium multiflorum]
MGKARDPKVAILPSTTRKGTTLSTSATLDSPSVISQLVSPPQASLAGTSAESENSHNIDNVSAMLDDSGSLGSFLDATIARSRQIENAETPNENATTPVNSPELDYSSDDPDEDYVELNDDFINRCNATADARNIKKFLTQYTVRHKLSPDPKFATSPICIKDKDYDFSLDLSHIAIVEKAPFCGTEKESAVEHMNELSSMSSLFSDDVKMRTYFVIKNFPFSLKDDAKTWKRTPDEAEELLARISRNHDDWNTPEPTPTPILKKRGLIELNDEDMREAKKSLKEKGLNFSSRNLLDSAAGGTFMSITLGEATKLLDNMMINYSEWHTERAPQAMLKEFISTQTAFNKSVEEKLGKIDILASKVDSLAADVDLLKSKVMPNRDIENKIITTENAIQVRINENIRLMAELHARWDREENEKLAKEKNVAKVWTITTTSNVDSSHVAAPPTINGKIIGVGNVSTPSAKRTKLPETAKTAETACDKAAEIFSNIGDDDPIDLDYNGLNFYDCHISEVIKFLQKLAKSPNASAINLAFTQHITNALIKAREEKLEREASIPRKLEDGWEPIIKMKVKDFDCNALCDLGASISVMPKKIYNMLDLPPLKNCYLDVNLADHSTKKPLGKVDNVRITVNNNLVPIDFVVLDIECNASCPIILGRPFLRTVGAIIDMKEGTSRRIDDNPRDLLELYRGITDDDCRTIQRGKIRNIQLPAIKYFAYYIATSILGRENTSNISSYHLAFLNAALTGQTPYHLGSLIARRLSNRGPIFGGTIALRILTHLRLPLDSNDVPLTPRRLDIAAMKSHHFVTADSTLDNMVYRMLFADGDEKEIPLPQPGLFSIDREPWSRTKEEVEEKMKIQDFHQQHDSEDAEPSYDYTVTYPGASSSTYPEYDPSSSYYGDTTSWPRWD